MPDTLLRISSSSTLTVVIALALALALARLHVSGAGAWSTVNGSVFSFYTLQPALTRFRLEWTYTSLDGPYGRTRHVPVMVAPQTGESGIPMNVSAVGASGLSKLMNAKESL